MPDTGTRFLTASASSPHSTQSEASAAPHWQLISYLHFSVLLMNESSTGRRRHLFGSIAMRLDHRIYGTSNRQIKQAANWTVKRTYTVFNSCYGKGHVAQDKLLSVIPWENGKYVQGAGAIRIDTMYKEATPQPIFFFVLQLMLS